MFFGDESKQFAVGVGDKVCAQQLPSGGMGGLRKKAADHGCSFGAAIQRGESVETEECLLSVADLGACLLDQRKHQVGAVFVQEAAQQISGGEGVSLGRQGVRERADAFGAGLPGQDLLKGEKFSRGGGQTRVGKDGGEDVWFSRPAAGEEKGLRPSGRLRPVRGEQPIAGERNYRGEVSAGQERAIPSLPGALSLAGMVVIEAREDGVGLDGLGSLEKLCEQEAGGVIRRIELVGAGQGEERIRRPAGGASFAGLLEIMP